MCMYAHVADREVPGPVVRICAEHLLEAHGTSVTQVMKYDRLKVVGEIVVILDSTV
jgi:hypothetical protein